MVANPAQTRPALPPPGVHAATAAHDNAVLWRGARRDVEQGNGDHRGFAAVSGLDRRHCLCAGSGRLRGRASRLSAGQPPGGIAGRSRGAACAGLQSAGVRAGGRAGHGHRHQPARPHAAQGRLEPARGWAVDRAGGPGLHRHGPVAAGSHRPGRARQPVACHRLAAVGGGFRPRHAVDCRAVAQPARHARAGVAEPGRRPAGGGAVVRPARVAAPGRGPARGVPGLGELAVAGWSWPALVRPGSRPV